MAQWIVVAIIMLAAAGYLVRQLWRSSTAEGCAGCGEAASACEGCSGCPEGQPVGHGSSL